MCRRFGGAFGDRAIPCEPVGTAPRAVRIGLLADIHIGDDNDNSDLKRALRIFDAKKADAVIAAGDLTDFGLLSELQDVAAAWNEVFHGSRRSDGEPVVRLFHYGDHDTALNFKVRQREVVEKGRWADYIPHIGPDVAWERRLPQTSNGAFIVQNRLCGLCDLCGSKIQSNQDEQRLS